MSTLTGPEIIRQVGLGHIVITPFDENLVGPNSVDVHLGDALYWYGDHATNLGSRTLIEDPISGGKVYALDSRHPPRLVPVPRTGDGWLLLPGRLHIGSTMEWTETYGFKPVIDGRSTAGRLGLFVHVTAGQGDNGFRGCWTLEIAVIEPLIIYPGQRLCQLTYETLEGAEVLYGETKNSSGRYQGMRAPVGAKSEDS